MADGKPRQNRGSGSRDGRSSGSKPGGAKSSGSKSSGGKSGGTGRSSSPGSSGGSRSSGAKSSGGKSTGANRDSSPRSSGDGRSSSGKASYSDKRGESSSTRRAGAGGSGSKPGSPRAKSGSRTGGKPPYQKSGSSGAARPRQREQLRTAGSGGGDLPKWIRDEVIRTAPKDRRDAILALLTEAADAFADARYQVARERLLRAKAMTSRSETVRELLGLSCYRLAAWEEALRELRAYRRIAGDTTHLAVEMDCLRALGRDADVPKVWAMLRELGASKAAEVELRVVYGSFLLDQGRPQDAWRVTDPGRIRADAHENDLRQWYVAAKAAVVLGDMKTADQLRRAIETRDIAFPGLVELTSEIAQHG